MLWLLCLLSPGVQHLSVDNVSSAHDHNHSSSSQLSWGEYRGQCSGVDAGQHTATRWLHHHPVIISKPDQSEISIILYQPIRVEYLPNTSRYCFIIRNLPWYHTIRLEWKIFSDPVKIFLISPCRGSIVAEYQRPWEHRGWWRGWWWRRGWHCGQLVWLLTNSLLRESPSWPGELHSSLTCPDPDHSLTVRTIVKDHT